MRFLVPPIAIPAAAIPTTSTATLTAAALAAATAKAASPAATALLGTRFIHNDVTPHEVLAIERLYRFAGIFIAGHFDEAKSPQLSRHLIANQCDLNSGDTGLLEPSTHILLGSLKRQIANIQLFHGETPLDSWQRETINSYGLLGVNLLAQEPSPRRGAAEGV
jgi:hypothetical protein